jgi:hypothetical protein
MFGTKKRYPVILRTERLGGVKDVPNEFPHFDNDRSRPKRDEERAPAPENTTHLIRDAPLPAPSTLLLLDVGVLKRFTLHHILRSYPLAGAPDGCARSEGKMSS